MTPRPVLRPLRSRIRWPRSRGTLGGIYWPWQARRTILESHLHLALQVGLMMCSPQLPAHPDEARRSRAQKLPSVPGKGSEVKGMPDETWFWTCFGNQLLVSLEWLVRCRDSSDRVEWHAGNILYYVIFFLREAQLYCCHTIVPVKRRSCRSHGDVAYLQLFSDKLCQPYRTVMSAIMSAISLILHYSYIFYTARIWP